ncbi:hypothetical protein B0H14DRAFT_3654609 [Mycena olivaceomarginata]|nr:hypothetical protein B0H14DRAFT_3654609 [Mycena olivaceomarginata]
MKPKSRTMAKFRGRSTPPRISNLRAFSNPAALLVRARSLLTEEAARVYRPSSLLSLTSRLCVSLNHAHHLDRRIDIPRATTAKGTAGCGKTHWFNSIPSTALSKAAPARATTPSASRARTTQTSRNNSCWAPTGRAAWDFLCGGYGAEWERLYRRRTHTTQKILVYSNGVGGAWAGANYSEATVPADLQFISDLLDEIRVGWLFIGGCLVNTIACAPVGGNVAAVAAGSGFFLPHRERRHLGAARWPLSVLEIHGGSDTEVPYVGGAGEGGTEPAIPDWGVPAVLRADTDGLHLIHAYLYYRLSRWATRNGCTAGNTTETLGSGDVHHSSWACAGAGVEGESVLQHWKVYDMLSALSSFDDVTIGENITLSALSPPIPTCYALFTRASHARPNAHTLVVFDFILAPSSRVRHRGASTSLDFSEIAEGQGPIPINASTIMMMFFITAVAVTSPRRTAGWTDAAAEGRRRKDQRVGRRKKRKLN